MSHSQRMICLLAGLCLAGFVERTQAQERFGLLDNRKGVVYIRRFAPGLPPAGGSGFFVAREGLIYTNRHVVIPDERAVKGTMLFVGVPSVKDPDTLEYFKAELVFAPEEKENLDFAVIKITGKKRDFPALKLAEERPALGSDVAVLGYPLVFDNQPNLSFNKGSISATRVKIDEKSYYQTDAVVNPGNSGGPLLNAKGEVIGIVTLRKNAANNIGFALYLDEVRMVARLAEQRAGTIKPEPGPVEGKALPVTTDFGVSAKNWIANGALSEQRGVLTIDNNGGPYWVTSKQSLPEDFQLAIRARIEFFKGRQVIYASQKNMLRLMSVRFGTADTKVDILERTGYSMQFSHAHMLLYKQGEVLKREVTGNTDEPFHLTISKLGGDLTIAVNSKIVMRHEDKKPIPGAHSVSIGGYLSRLHLLDVSVIEMRRDKAPPVEIPRK